VKGIRISRPKRTSRQAAWPPAQLAAGRAEADELGEVRVGFVAGQQEEEFQLADFLAQQAAQHGLDVGGRQAFVSTARIRC